MRNVSYEFTKTVKGFINTAIIYIAFNFENVRRLDYNNKSIYLWLNAKGDVHYCFTLFDKEYYTTSIVKLSNVLTSHFGYKFEAVNNDKEHLKKITNATVNLNKALNDVERRDYLNGFQQPDLPQLGTPINTLIDNELPKPQAYGTIPQQNPFQNQDILLESVVQLSTYFLESHLSTMYIKMDELPIIHKDVYAPQMKQAFFIDKTGLNCKNNFIATEYMLKPLYPANPEQSFILKLIIAMTDNLTQALKILAWITDSFTSLRKLPFALVLYSTNETYMQLFYDEILTPLLNINECEMIESDSLDKKSLSNKLDQKFIYYFHNITAPVILDKPAYELINRLIHKDTYKLNSKIVTTMANILITSTTNYIPLISKDVPTAIVNVNSNLDDLCAEFSVRSNPYEISKLIENDLDNFVSIMRAIDLNQLYNTYQIIDNNINDVHPEILNGTSEPAEVFDNLIRNKDITPFKLATRTKKDEQLVEEMETNFLLSRVDKAHLLNYFVILFGKGIYKSNTTFIKILREDYSKTGEPFGDNQAHVRKGRAYYFL